MKEQIYKICTQLNDGQIAVTEATEQLFDLFAVSQQREQLVAFYEHLNDIDKPLRHGDGYKEVDDFIAANCG